jgi:hypothetical protein
MFFRSGPAFFTGGLAGFRRVGPRGFTLVDFALRMVPAESRFCNINQSFQLFARQKHNRPTGNFS